MNSKVAFVITAFALVSNGCADFGKPVKPISAESFEIEYTLLNTGDATITDWRIDALTYYPRVNRSTYQYRIFLPVGPFDTVSLKPPDLGYVGCFTQMAATVAKEWEPGVNRARCFVLRRDTVQARGGRITVFRWPEDTARAIEVPWPPTNGNPFEP
jgi:hypothetical protein